jgi:hypothetical protein
MLNHNTIRVRSVCACVHIAGYDDPTPSSIENHEPPQWVDRGTNQCRRVSEPRGVMNSRRFTQSPRRRSRVMTAAR